MKDKIQQIGTLLSENEVASNAVHSAKTKEEAIDILGQYGIDISIEEFDSIGCLVTSDELPEEILAFVSGGSWSGFWRGVRDFFQGFLDAF